MKENHLKRNLIALGITIVGLALISLVVFATGRYDIDIPKDEIRVVMPSTPPETSIKPGTPPSVPVSITPTLDVFTASPRPTNIGNIVGYFAGGEFLMYVPDWIAEHWKIDTEKDGSRMAVSLRNESSDRDFSDILMTLTPITETHNAESMYKVYHQVGFDQEAGISTETILSDSGGTRIYHVQIVTDEDFSDIYYMDGKKNTLEIQFSGSVKNFIKYSTKIKEFVKGLSAGTPPRG